MYELVYYVNGKRLTKQGKEFNEVLKIAYTLPLGTMWLIFNPQGVLLYTNKDEQALFN